MVRDPNPDPNPSPNPDPDPNPNPNPNPNQATLALSVLKNAFEDQTVELRGLAYAQDVAIEDLPAAEESTGDEAVSP